MTSPLHSIFSRQMNLQEPFHHALPVDELLFDEGLHVTNAGWERILPGQPYPNTDHPYFYHIDWNDGRIIPFFCIAWLVSGQGEFQTKKQHLSLEKGQVFLILPGEWHRHRPDPETGWVLAWIEFNGTLPYQWWRCGAFGKNPNLLAVRNLELFALQFQNLLHEVHQCPASNARIFSLMTIGIMAQLLENGEVGGKVKNGGDELVDRAIECVWNFSHGVIDVEGIARQMGVGRRTLERRFRVAKGHSVLEEIQHCRFSRAVRLLVETPLPIKTIVQRSGFGSYEQLRKTFLKFSDMTPQEYRDHALVTRQAHTDSADTGSEIFRFQSYGSAEETR